MGKGDETKQQILEQAMNQASMFGLEGLSIGGLAKDLGMSKSGLFAHFQSKENLQIETIELAASVFTDAVVRPALKAPRGEPRVVALYEHWLEWATHGGLEGGCIFVNSASEFDDRPGAVRDALAKTQRDWTDVLARAARIAVEEGHFRSDLDEHEFAFSAYSLMLGAHLYARLLRDDEALIRARRAFERLLLDAKP